MSNIYLSGENSRLYMKFKKIMPSAQGMGIWEDRAYILYNTGVCAVYDLKQRKEEPLARFLLGSYNDGIPTNDYLNHANSCMFSDIHYHGNPIPLLYVVIGTGVGEDEDGFYYRCAVENIVRQTGEDGIERYVAETIQIISYRSGGEDICGFEKVGWGCPAFLPDCRKGSLYIFSARYRTMRGCVPLGEQNTYIVTRFSLPEVELGKHVCLCAEDIKDQFTESSEVMFTQGGTIADGKLFYTFGLPQKDYPVTILVFDLDKGKLCARIGNLDEAFMYEEIECCGFYNGKLLCNTSNGSIFEVMSITILSVTGESELRPCVRRRMFRQPAGICIRECGNGFLIRICWLPLHPANYSLQRAEEQSIWRWWRLPTLNAMPRRIFDMTTIENSVIPQNEWEILLRFPPAFPEVNIWNSVM